MSDVVSPNLPCTQLRVSKLSKVTAQCLQVDWNLQILGYKAQNLMLHHHVPNFVQELKI